MSNTAVTVSSNIYADLIDLAINSGVVPLLLGPPGVGKSAYLNGAASTNNFMYLDVRLTGKEASDIGGLPNFVDILDSKGVPTGNKVTTFIPTDLFPLQGITSQDALIKRDKYGNTLMEKDGKTPQRYDGWLVNLEEFTSADDAVQSACYQLILDRQVGKYKLHDNVYITACGNGENHGAIAGKIGTAIKSRVTTILVESEYKTWMAWAQKEGLNNYILDFLTWRPEFLHKFDPRSDDINFPCNRTWHKLSDILETEGNYSDAAHRLALGTVGKTAVELKNFIAYYALLPKISAILKDPKKADVPNDAGQLYAMCGVMSQALVDEHKDIPQLKKLMEYIERMPKEHQTVTISNSIRKLRKVAFAAPIGDWCSSNAALLASVL